MGAIFISYTGRDPEGDAWADRLAEHPIEEVGEKLRAMMPWIKKGALVDSFA